MDCTAFRSYLYDWYKSNKRVLPWRETKDPYKIWLSEIIMQQTKIIQGLPYYNTFVRKYPTVYDLANATEDDVLATWQGLGYYSRARNLHNAAKDIVSTHSGVFPMTYDDVIRLKGVGEYTASAIMSFAFNIPYPAIDGNMYRVLSRIFGVSEAIDVSEGKKTFKELALYLLDNDNPRDFNNAMMDFGATQCTPKQTDCDICPFANECVANISGLVSQLPVKKNKVKVRERFFYYFDIRVDGFLFLTKRSAGDIWQGLFDLLLFEKNKKTEMSDILSEFESFLSNLGVDLGDVKVLQEYNVVHILTHQKINVSFVTIQIVNDSLAINGFVKVSTIDVLDYPISTLLKNYLLLHAL